MIETIRRFCREQALLSPGQRVICALSGGADSVALLWAMYLLRESWHLELSAAHFNHGLRGAESDRDEEFVRSLCRQYDIPLQVGRGSVQPGKKGVEDAARRARYAFLESLDPQAVIATAHTADDNAETVLMHLLRGSGLRGLGGIAPRRGRIIRPMLEVTRQEVMEFLTQWHLPHVEDSSNASDLFLRNRIRREIMPVLARENPSFSRRCGITARQLRQDAACLDRLARQRYGQMVGPRGLHCPTLLAQESAVSSRVLELFCREMGVLEMDFDQISKAFALAASSKPSAWARFSGGVILERRYEYLTRRESVQKPEPVALPVPGTARFGPWNVEARIGKKIAATPLAFSVPCATIDTNLLLRARAPGDSLRLPGGAKSLRQLLIDRKIPAAQRDLLPVVTCGGKILGVAGIGANADDFSPADAVAVIVTFIKEDRERYEP